MPESPRDEVARRRALREHTLRGQSKQDREKRKVGSREDVPRPTEPSPWQQFADELEVKP
jgi:hypothetical protein